MKCSKCGKNPARPKVWTCAACRTETLRLWRKNPEPQRKIKCRTRTIQLILEGEILVQRCRVCGEKAERHHLDYDDPYAIDWLCKTHHRAEHARLSQLQAQALEESLQGQPAQ